jgi:M6 family metalloprotease-like protein
MILRRLFYIANIVAVISLVLQGGGSNLYQGAAEASLEGTFTILWGDGAPGTGETSTQYMLATNQGAIVRLVISDEALASPGGPISLDGKQVEVQGTWLDGENSLLVRSIRLAQGVKSGVDGVYGPQPWVSILCKFSDVTDEPRDKAYFEGMYSSEYPGLDHFWQQNSYGLVNLQGSGVFGWVVLPHIRDYYLPGGNLDWWKAAADCTGVANPYVDFSPYVGINLMFNAELDGFAWGGSWYACLDGVCKSWRTTWEPPWGYGNIGVIAHETGHGFGLPHSEGNCQQVYDNRWDVMSDVWSNGADPIYGTLGQHTISYHKELLGWMTPDQVFTAKLGTLKMITLEKLALPQADNFLGAVIPIDGQTTHFYTLEVRQPSNDLLDYDKWLPGFAVIIHEVTQGQPEPAILIDQDGDCNTADAGAMFTPGEVFTDAVHGITVSIDSATPTGYVVTINNRFKPMQLLAINGVDFGYIGESLPFTATVSPADASIPITYTWETIGMEPVQHTGGITDTIDLSWEGEGTKTITVTATNAGGELVTMRQVDILPQVVPAGVEISGPQVGYVAASTTFNAQVSPISATLPITYVWTIDGNESITHTGDLSDGLIYRWDGPGMHLIEIKAFNVVGEVADMWTITIYFGNYLPLSLRD